MPDVFFVIMPEACFRFVLVPVCRADGRPAFCGRDGAVPADAWVSPSLFRFGGVRRRDVVLVRAVEHQVDADAGQTAVYEGQNAEHPDFGQHFGERRSHALDADKGVYAVAAGEYLPQVEQPVGNAFAGIGFFIGKNWTKHKVKSILP